jgi:hypothetical protein
MRIVTRATLQASAQGLPRAGSCWLTKPGRAELRARTNRMRERAGRGSGPLLRTRASRCCEHAADGLPRAAQAATSKSRGLPQASCGRAGMPGGAPRRDYAAGNTGSGCKGAADRAKDVRVRHAARRAPRTRAGPSRTRRVAPSWGG